MAAKARVIPNCVNASNPYHECTESCLGKIADAKPQKKNSGSFKDYRTGMKHGEVGKGIVEGKRVLQACPKASNPYHHCDGNCSKQNAETGADTGSILTIPALSRKKKQESQPGTGLYRASDNVPVSKALNAPDASSPKSFHSAGKKIGPPDLSQQSPSDAVLTSANQLTSKEKAEKKVDILQGHPPNNITGKKATSSAGTSLDFSFTGIVHGDGESDDGDQSIASECRVPVGKYHVKESLASILLSIMDKHGDVAANCQLESLSMRSYYLECVCLVVQELQSTPIMQLTKSKVKELLAILKDAESAQISVAWLLDILNEIAQDIDLFTQHRVLESENSQCDHDLESTRAELESGLKMLAEKENEVAAIKERIAEARNRLMELELKASELSKQMLSVESDVDKIRGKSLDELL